MRSDFMKALLICGTVIVALPPVSDYLHNQTVAELLSRPDADSVYLEGRMSSEYRVACYLLGVGMILTAVAASLLSRPRPYGSGERQDQRFAETVMMPPGEGREA